ncbi:MAG: DnaA/Hda family protein, partial [Solirubrobacterales bacterium]
MWISCGKITGVPVLDMVQSSRWNRLQKQLANQLEPEEFATWFKPLRVRSDAPESLILVAPDDRFLTTLEESYRPAVDRAIAGLDGPGFEVLFSVDGEFDRADGGPAEPLRDDRDTESLLNPRYTFETFVVGSSNQFAHAAARAVAESPSHSYNPLFLYGGVGLGKTHLLHAIGHHILRNHPRLRVMYLA